MDIAMIVTDLDGTLLRSDKTISAHTAEVLRRCQARGMLLAFATARPPRTVERFALDARPDVLICHNGALVRDARGDEARCAIPFDEAVALARRLAAQNAGATVSLELGDRLYANFDMSGIRFCEDYIHTDFCGLPRGPVYKLIAGISSPDDIGRIAALLPPELYVQRCEEALALIMARGATKLNGIRQVAAARGIPLERVAAFGDDVNDVEMLRACGVGVAVANALSEVRTAADCVCGANDEDGMARWLEENALG